MGLAEELVQSKELALSCRPLRGLMRIVVECTWGLRPRLYATHPLRGLKSVRLACGPGGQHEAFPSASRTQSAPSLRSRRKHKAWGVSPRKEMKKWREP